MLNILSNIRYSRFFDTTAYRLIRRNFGGRPFKCLDVGGWHAGTVFTKIFPNCEYSVIDHLTEYNDDENSRMRKFWEMDLTKLQFDEIPDDYFDMVNMSHVIEHLPNGNVVISEIQKKLKKGGVIYIEYPGVKSTKLPRMRKRNATLNFFDDPTHVRIFSVLEVQNILLEKGFTTIKCGTRRNWYYAFVLMPPMILGSFITRRPLRGAYFWDLFGFAEFVFARKS